MPLSKKQTKRLTQLRAARRGRPNSPSYWRAGECGRAIDNLMLRSHQVPQSLVMHPKTFGGTSTGVQRRDRPVP